MSDKKNQRKFDIGNHFENIFKATDSANAPKEDAVINISVKNLVPFKNHPFKLYEGERFTDMVESIKTNGIIMPIIVRLLEDEIYEILSGHNRVEAAKAAGIETVPAIISANLSDDEALLIVTETNLRQRSFADLTHSERAVALKQHMSAIRQQGKRNDLINEINNLLNADKTNENATSRLLVSKLRSDEKTGDKYGLDARNVSRYIRLCELNESLLERVDNNEIGLYAAVSLSYLPLDEQTELNKILEENKYKVDMKKAEMLRSYSENKKLTAGMMEQILSGSLNKKPKTKSPATFKIKYKLYTKYFDEDMKQAEVEAIIDKALEDYFKSKK